MSKDGYLTADSTTGLSKDELLQYAYRPLWVWLRGTLITAYWLAWLMMLIAAIIIIKNAPKCNAPPPLAWWQRSPIYQIQVASFSDGGHPMNGQGDIAGVENRLEYIERLGVRTVCLSSIFNSSLNDSSSITDFRTIAPHFGTLDDLLSLIKKMEDKDMKLILDFIPNHTSDKHMWFQKSIKKEDPYTYYYVWGDPQAVSATGKPLPPNDWVNANGGSAWEWNEERKEFYLHQFSREQPDLNYDNPQLIQEMKDILLFWLSRGVSGFRLINVAHLVEDYVLNNMTFHYPEGFNILQEFREVMDNSSSGDPRVLLVEDDIPLQTLPLYYGNASTPLAHLAISTEFSSKIRQNITAVEMLRNVRRWLTGLPGTAWPNWMVGHKNANRLASRVGSSLAEAINMIILLLPGTPMTYYGDEIGMEDARDYEAIFSYSPMQWNAGKHAGFSSANTTWVPVNDNYHSLNVEAEEQADWSHIKIYRALVEARKSEAVMNGQTEFKLLENQVLAYTRVKKGVPGFLVAANFDDHPVTVDLTTLNYVPPTSSLVAFSTAYQTDFRVRSKVVNNAVSLPRKGGLVTTFVPQFPIDS